MNIEKSPSLSDLLLLEETLQNIDDSVITITALIKLLKNKIHKEKILILIHYLEDKNRIAVTSKGVTWIHTTSPLLHKEISTGLEQSKLTKQEINQINGARGRIKEGKHFTEEEAKEKLGL